MNGRGPTTLSLGDQNDHHGKLLATEPNWDDPPSREYAKRFVGSEVWLVELRFSM